MIKSTISEPKSKTLIELVLLVPLLRFIWRHCICWILALGQLAFVLLVVRLGLGELELEPAVLPARLEELP